MNSQLLPAIVGPRTRMVPTALGDLSVRTAGHGPRRVVLWPSILTDSHIFDAVADRLAPLCTFFLIDGPGHGQSSGRAQEFTGAEAGQAMLAVMDALGLRCAVVGGVSWGGLTAAEVAMSAPGRVEALVLMNTPMDIDGDRPSFGDRMIAFGARWIAGLKVFRNGVARSFFDEDSLRRNPTYSSQFHSMLATANRRELAAAVKSVILRGIPLRGRLHEITVPTLMISGIADKLYPLEGQAEAALRLRDARFAPVPGHHISPVDAADEVTKELRAFLLERIPA